MAVQDSQDRFVRFASAPASPAAQDFHQAFESLVISRSGGVLIVGWVDDSTAPLEAITVIGNGWSLRFDANVLARVRRADVEKALGKHTIHRFGYFGFIATGEKLATDGEFRIEIALAGDWRIPLAGTAKIIGDEELLNVALSYLADSRHFEDPELGAVAAIDGGVANEIVVFRQHIAGRAGNPYVKRFASGGSRHKGSVIVSLHGAVEAFSIQNALFATGPAATDYEFIYLCDDPALAETLLAQARLAAKLYGTDQTIAILPSKTTFGAASNAGAAIAQSDRLLLVDPGLFPRDRDWAEKHGAILDSRPSGETKLFGAPLFYENGAFCHAGLYYDLRSGPYLLDGEIVRFQLADLKSLAGGPPQDTARTMEARPVPGIGGAFMSFQRNWFETLGGFSESYLHGDFQDADICLKSIAAGVPPWLHDLHFWHLDWKRDIDPAAYKGGSIVNRWLFSASWGDRIAENLSGRMPAHPAFRKPALAEADIAAPSKHNGMQKPRRSAA